MSYAINFTSDFERHFKRLAKKYKSLPSDLSRLVDQLKDDPEIGVSLGSGLFKIRPKISSKGQGKSGGARVIYFLIKKEKIFIW
jgi:mRNA-degrading endonuclease RelE of RelBE toxin-antitoxin system